MKNYILNISLLLSLVILICCSQDDKNFSKGIKIEDMGIDFPFEEKLKGNIQSVKTTNSYQRAGATNKQRATSITSAVEQVEFNKKGSPTKRYYEARGKKAFKATNTARYDEYDNPIEVESILNDNSTSETYVYNYANRTIKKYYKKGGKRDSLKSSYYEFNEQGKITQQKTLSQVSKERWEQINVSEYDTNGHLINRKIHTNIYDKDGIRTNPNQSGIESKHQYDQNGNLTKSTGLSNSIETTTKTYQYDTDNRLLSEKSNMNGTNILEYKYEYHHDDTGHLKEKVENMIRKGNQGEIMLDQTTKTIYDDNKNPIHDTTIKASTKGQTNEGESKVEYKHDKEGNWIYRKTIGKALIIISEREIQYY